MKKIGNTQSGTLLVEMADAEYEKLTAGAAIPVDALAEQIDKGRLNKKLFRESEGRVEW